MDDGRNENVGVSHFIAGWLRHRRRRQFLELVGSTREWCRNHWSGANDYFRARHRLLHSH
jgi:hypothetical protein